MEGIHVGFAQRICTDASSKPLPIFYRLGTNPTGKTALHLPWSDFRAGFGAENAGIQEYYKDDKPEITGNRPCQAARIPSMYAPVFSPLTSSFVVASAPLKVSLWRRMSAVATIFFILTVALCASDKQHPAP